VATVPTGCVECGRDLVVAQLDERVEEKGVPFRRLHQGECTRERSTISRLIARNGRVVLVHDPVGASIGGELSTLDPPAAKQVRGDVVSGRRT
jgi:hypothetical protein